MNKVQRFCFTALSSLALVTAVSAVPAGRHQDPPPAQSPAQTQSVSGTIASVENSSFTLTVNSSTAHQMQATAAAPKTMTFQIDKNTTVEGKLKVKATADVTYRQENGNNIAISVRVAP
jgi:hypothetical protein